MNAKAEFLQNVILKDLLCAHVSYQYEYGEFKDYFLKIGYSETDLNQFLNQLDFEYDSGYGAQYLFGNVWLKGGKKWLSRYEYDGSEQWILNKLPEIPKECQ